MLALWVNLGIVLAFIFLWKSFYKLSVLVILKYFIIFSNEAICVWNFVCEKSFNYRINLFNSFWNVQLRTLLFVVLISFFLLEISSFHVNFQIICSRLFQVFCYGLFNICRFCSDVLFFILNIDNVSFLTLVKPCPDSSGQRFICFISLFREYNFGFNL